jgi:streptogramin lyase
MFDRLPIRVRACLSAAAAMIVLGGLAPLAAAAEQAGTEEKPGLRYPHVNAAVTYQVVPQWPRRPAGLEWGQTPAVAVDPLDRVWIFTRAKPEVQIYSAGGEFVRALRPDVRRAHGIRFDPQGNLWLVDVGDHVVMQLSPEGKLLRTLGVRGQPGNDATHFNQPTDVAVTPAGEIFVSDGYGNSRVVHLDRDGKFVKAWGKRGSAPGEFSIPHALVIDSRGTIYVADRNNVRIQVFDEGGKLLDVWDNLLVPWGLWIGKDDAIWACGCSPMAWREEDECLSCPPKDQLVMRFDRSGKVRQVWTFPKGEDGKERPGDLNWVHGVALDSQGSLYLSDIIGKRVQKFARVGQQPGTASSPQAPEAPARR